MLLNEIPWTIPLTVRLSNGLTHTFASVYEALDFLENEWPLRNGERYERAVRTCRRALNRMTPAAVAREPSSPLALKRACRSSWHRRPASRRAIASRLRKRRKGGGSGNHAQTPACAPRRRLHFGDGKRLLRRRNGLRAGAGR